RMAQAVFSALRTVPGTDYLRVPFTPYMRIYDVIEVVNPRLRSETEYYAIEDLQLHFSADEWWTEITASESVKVRHKVWLAKEAKMGVKKPFTPSDLSTRRRPPAPTNLTVVTGDDAAVAAAVSLDWDDVASSVWIEYGVYRGTNPNFANATKIAEVSASRFVDVNVQVGTTYYYWVTAIDWSENESLPSNMVEATPGAIKAGIKTYIQPTPPIG